MREVARCIPIVALLAIALAPLGATAQDPCRPDAPVKRPDCPKPVPPPEWIGEFTVFSANAVIGGVTAGVRQKLRGGSFSDGFTRGAIGGGVVYLGKRVAVQRFDGAGFAGRQLAAVGSSVVRNAAEGQPSLSRMMLPLGPLRLYYSQRPNDARLRVKVDAMTAGWLFYGIVEEELHFDLERSLSAGAPVFLTRGKLILPEADDDSLRADGVEAAGVLMLADVPEHGPESFARVFVHERVHVLQSDYVFVNWTDPATTWMLERLPGGRYLDRYVDFNLSNEVRGLLGKVIERRENRPWELEADFLEKRR